MGGRPAGLAGLTYLAAAFTLVHGACTPDEVPTARALPAATEASSSTRAHFIPEHYVLLLAGVACAMFGFGLGIAAARTYYRSASESAIAARRAAIGTTLHDLVERRAAAHV